MAPTQDGVNLGVPEKVQKYNAYYPIRLMPTDLQSKRSSYIAIIAEKEKIIERQARQIERLERRINWLETSIQVIFAFRLTPKTTNHIGRNTGDRPTIGREQEQELHVENQREICTNCFPFSSKRALLALTTFKRLLDANAYVTDLMCQGTGNTLDGSHVVFYFLGLT